jgi:hypothetical protein
VPFRVAAVPEDVRGVFLLHRLEDRALGRRGLLRHGQPLPDRVLEPVPGGQEAGEFPVEVERRPPVERGRPLEDGDAQLAPRS